MLRIASLVFLLLASGCAQTTTDFPNQAATDPVAEVPVATDEKKGGSNNVPVAVAVGLVVGAAIMLALAVSSGASSGASDPFYDPIEID